MSEDDKMIDILINSVDNRTELEKHMDYIAKLLEDNLDDVIENALDAQLYISLPSRQLVGLLYSPYVFLVLYGYLPNLSVCLSFCRLHSLLSPLCLMSLNPFIDSIMYFPSSVFM